MTILSPKYCVTCIAILFAFHVSAQNSMIKQFNNGKVTLSYQKVVASNSYELRLVYKNDQIIYKEETDSLVLHNNNEVADFINGFNKTIESLSDDKATVYIEKPSYSIFKYDKGIIGTFVAISNPTGNVVASNNKAEAMSILNFLKSIEFGKE